MFVNATGLEKAPDGIKELGSVSSLMSESRDLRTALVGPQFSSDEKKAVIGLLKTGLGLSETSVKFLGFVAERGVASQIDEIVDYAVKIYLEKKKRARATVVTPVAMDRVFEARIKDSIKKLTGREIDIEYDIDPSLLGGVLVKVGSTMFDSSIRGQLRLLKDELVKE